MDDKVLIGKVIKEERKRKGMTQFMLAEQVGLHEKQISRIESGLNFPNLMSFIKIISVLDLKMSDFTYKHKPKTNIIADEIIHIIQSANENELKIYHDVIKSIRKNLKVFSNTNFSSSSQELP